MSVTVKVLVATKELEAAQTVQYTCLTQSAILDKVVAFNNSATTASVLTLSIAPYNASIGPANQFVEKTIQPLEAYLFPELTGMALKTGEVVVTDPTNATIVFRMSGREIT